MSYQLPTGFADPLQTSMSLRGDEQRGSPKGLRLDEGKVAAKLGAKK